MWWVGGREQVVFHCIARRKRLALGCLAGRRCATEISSRARDEEEPMEQERANRPLSDVTVIDFGQIFQGPYASLLLAKAGAFVIKIEPLHGEPRRRLAAPGKSATLPFAMLNQNKHAITLNLKHERGHALLEEMVKRADVLLEK